MTVYLKLLNERTIEMKTLTMKKMTCLIAYAVGLCSKLQAVSVADRRAELPTPHPLTN